MFNLCFLIILTVMVTKQHGLVLQFQTANPTDPTSSTRSNAFDMVSLPYGDVDGLRRASWANT